MYVRRKEPHSGSGKEAGDLGGVSFMDFEKSREEALKRKLWDIIEAETEEVETRIPEVPQGIEEKIEDSKEETYEKLVERLKKEGVWN